MSLDFRRSHSVGRLAAIFASTAICLGARAAAAVAAGDTLLAESPSAASPARESATAIPASCHPLREHDQIWLVSTRELGCPSDASAPPLRFWKYDANGGWIVSTLESFLAADNPSVPTDFYVHGNFDTADEAVQRGLAAYGRLAAQTPADRPLRFVIWSWPTDRGKHPLQLTRMHAQRSDVDAFYLAWLVERIDCRVKIGLVGYSFGARVVSGALHLLGGGQLLGLTLVIDAKAARPTVRAVLLAAAEDCDRLSPGHPNGEAAAFVDKMLLLNNGCDSALKLYPYLDRCERAEALGYVGICGPIDSQKIDQRDVCCAIGKEHDWSRYFSNDGLVADMLPYLFLDAAK